MTVPVTFGSVIVRSAVGSNNDIVVSKSLSVSPSKMIGVVPESTPVEVA